MERNLIRLWMLGWIVAISGVFSAGLSSGQDFTNLYSFTGGSDGSHPYGSLTLSGNTLYGTTVNGGDQDNGAIFAINTDGTSFTNLHSFGVTTGYDDYSNPINSDGAYPLGGMVLSGNTLYGAANGGGSTGSGTIFAINTDGTGFTNLYTFSTISNGTNSDGYSPNPLILLGNTLYGTTDNGGSFGNGTVFSINTDGTGFTNLYSFSALSNQTNSDGAYPSFIGGLAVSGNTLYGATSQGGRFRSGTVFSINTDGTGFTNVYNFTARLNGKTNSDGAAPNGGLIVSGGKLYGTTGYGGDSGVGYGYGTIFAVNTDGTGFTNLHNISQAEASPFAGLTLFGNTLYGTTDGLINSGTVFAINTDGTGYTNFYGFVGDNARPSGGMIFSGNTLYGTANNYNPGGAVFKITLPSVSVPELTIILSGGNVILSWPTNYAGFTLQTTTNLVPPVVWSTNQSLPVVVGGQNIVTNSSPSVGQQFFRLIQ